MSKVKAVIFDLDGTLVHLPIRWDKIRNNLKNFFNTKEEFRPLIPTIKKLSQTKEMLRDAFKIISKEELLAVNNLVIIDNAINVLQQIASMNMIMALATMQGRESTEQILTKTGINNLFSHIQTRDDNPDKFLQIKRILELFDITPHDVIVIGDRLYDIESATKAGCKVILVGKKMSENTHNWICIEKLSDLNMDIIQNNDTN